MAESDSDEAVAHGIAAERWGGCDAIRFIGQGSNNVVFLAEHAGERIVIKLSKPHRVSGALGEYRKEAWCAAGAANRGVRTPQVLAVGVRQRPFAMLEYARGRVPDVSQALSVWRDLGAAAARIHEITVSGWGGDFAGDGVFRESWHRHLEYNIGSLHGGDELLERGVLDARSSSRLRQALEGLRRSGLRFGLCHGDIAPWNVLIDDGEQPWLLDWGCAVAHVVPHHEINEILRGPKPSHEDLAAFLEGYGISEAAYAEMMPDLLALAALREVDTLRWAVDRMPAVIDEMSVKAKAAVARLE